MRNPCFEFFELIAAELTVDNERVLTRKDLESDQKNSTLLEELNRYTKAQNTEDSIAIAVQYLTAHFEARGGVAPFTYDPQTGLFTAIDLGYLNFVVEISAIRSVGTRSKDFEISVMKRLGNRATGSLHRVGHPRSEAGKSRAAFNAHLKTLGFNGNVLTGAEKDGGLDILWLLPVGAVPHVPIVSVQCKNASFTMEDGDLSVGPFSRSFMRHLGLQPSVHVPCVFFNDYIYPERMTTKQLNFVPLGLSDLIPAIKAVSTYEM